MALNNTQIVKLYQKRAKHYDLSANLYHLLGFREQVYRQMAIEKINLNKGDLVVDIGCGTGLNFSLLHKAVGPTGKIIGVDLTDAMLSQADRRVKHNGWSNVDLIQCDATTFVFPNETDAVLSSFAITMAKNYSAIIKHAACALKYNGHFVILDLKKPETMPMPLVKLGVFLTKPFGVSLDLANRHPWESLQRYFNACTVTDLYGGFAYIACGEWPIIGKLGTGVVTGQCRSDIKVN